MTTQTVNTAITRLVIEAFDRAGVRELEWKELKISPSKLEQLRLGKAVLEDADLSRISRLAGEPWEHVILRLLDDGAAMTSETRELIISLQMLARAADTEASEVRSRTKPSRGGQALAKRLRVRHRTSKLSA